MKTDTAKRKRKTYWVHKAHLLNKKQMRISYDGVSKMTKSNLWEVQIVSKGLDQ